MNIQEVASRLDGVQYGEESKILTGDYRRELRKEGIVVVYGYSDDLAQFEGAISDEFGAYEHYFTSKGLLRNECDNDDCPYFKKLLQEARYYIKPVWCESDAYCWTYDTNIPHATFDVMECEDKYCRGIVFKLGDLV
jgi:hypothetical protein